MESFRSDVIPKLNKLVGTNLYTLYPKNEDKNKGWIGLCLEKYIGLSSGNLQKPDGSDFELKSTSLVLKDGQWFPKETIKVTQLNPKNILNEIFETSALWKKLSRLVFVGVSHESETECKVVRVASIDVEDKKLIEEIKGFWEEVQSLVGSGEIKDFVNFGSSEDLIQLRPTGDGKTFSTCPITGDKYPARAFYATKRLISELIKN